MAELSNEQLCNELIALSAKMLFPPQAHQQPDRITRKLDDPDALRKRETRTAKREHLRKTNDLNRWAYITDQRISYLHRKITYLNDGDTKNYSPIADGSSGVIDLVPKSIDTGSIVPILIYPEDLLRFLERAPPVVVGDAKLSSIHGQVAGSILWNAYHLQTVTSSSSLTRALELTKYLYPKRFDYQAGRPGLGDARFAKSYSNAALKSVWAEFRSVAHLWAAWLVMKKDLMSATSEPLSNIDHVKFVHLSESFAEFGINSLSPNTRPPVPLLLRTMLEMAPDRICDGQFVRQEIPIKDEIVAYLADATVKK